MYKFCNGGRRAISLLLALLLILTCFSGLVMAEERTEEPGETMTENALPDLPEQEDPVKEEGLTEEASPTGEENLTGEEGLTEETNPTREENLTGEEGLTEETNPTGEENPTGQEDLTEETNPTGEEDLTEEANPTVEKTSEDSLEEGNLPEAKTSLPEETMENQLNPLEEAMLMIKTKLRSSRTEAEWSGAFNLTSTNNNVTSVPLPVSEDGLVEKWKCKVSEDSSGMGGSYAGQVVIVDGYLYTTGADGLVKVDKNTGEIVQTVSGIGSGGHMYYDYLAYGQDQLYVATLNSLSAYNLDDLNQGAVWSVSESLGMYHPLVYHAGLLYCNGKVFQAETGEQAYVLDGEFNWSAGAFVTLENEEETEQAYYISDLYSIYAVKAQTGELLDSWRFYEGTYSGTKSASPVAYYRANNRLYWGNSKKNEFYSIQIDPQTGKFVSDSTMVQSEAYQTACAPVIYRDRAYVAAKDGHVYIYDADTLDCLGVTSNDITMIRSTPILCTAYEGETGKVYLLMQSYDDPGTVYALEEDYDDSNDSVLEPVARPSLSTGLAYAYEQLAFDEEGALYCYNESGHFFKFMVSSASLNSLEVEEALNELGFTSANTDYKIIVPQSSVQATVRFTLPSKTDYQVKSEGKVLNPTWVDQAWQVEVPLTAGSGAAEITLTGSDHSQRTYSLQFIPASDNARLSGLVVRNKGNVSASKLTLTPAFDSDTYEYTAAKDPEKDNTYDSIWPTPADSNALVTVTAVSGVDKIVSDTYVDQHFFNVYFAKETAVVEINVVAEDGQSRQTYQVTLQGGKDSGGGSGGESESITVTFSLRGDTQGRTYEKDGNSGYEMWIDPYELTLDPSEAEKSGSLTVMDALYKALDEAGLSYEENNGAIVAIDGLCEKDNGPNSGWMYEVNGSAPVCGAAEQRIYDGDDIYWFYVRDYTKESDMSEYEDSGSSTSEDTSASFVANVQKGEAFYNLTESDFDNLLEQARNKEQAGYLEFKLDVPKDLQSMAKYYTLRCPISKLAQMPANKDKVFGLTFNAAVGYFSVLNDALTVLNQQKAGARYLSLQMQKLDKQALTPEQQELVGEKSLINQYSLSLDKQEITLLSGGTLAMGMSYTMPTGKNLSGCYLYRLEGNTLSYQLIRGYDPLAKVIYFQNNQPGIYVLSEEPLLAPEQPVETIPSVEPLMPAEEKNISSSFVDIAGNYYRDAIIQMEQAGLFKGDGKGHFYPDQILTQAMLVTVLANYAGIQDEAEDTYYTFPFKWAVDNKLIREDTQPEANVNREDLAVTLCNYLEYSQQVLQMIKDGIIYNDILAVSPENREKVKAILEAEIMDLNEQDNFEPMTEVNRAFCAYVMQRFLANLAR